MRVINNSIIINSKNCVGQISVKAATMKQHRDMKRDERRHQANQIRKNKRQEAIAAKRSLGGSNAPFLTCIIPLHQSIDPMLAVKILENCDEQAIVCKTETITHIAQPRSKQRFSFIIPPFGKCNELQVLDCLKVCDSTIFLLSANTNDAYIDNFGKKILEMAIAQGIPMPIITLVGLETIALKKRASVKMNIQKSVSSLLPNERIMTLDSNSDGLNLFRRISDQKRNVLLNKQRHPHLLAENFEYFEDSKLLKVAGFLRGQTCLSVDSLVHIPGLGDFQMCQIDLPSDPYKLDNKNEISNENTILARIDYNKLVPIVTEANETAIRVIPENTEKELENSDSEDEDKNSEKYMSCDSEEENYEAANDDENTDTEVENDNISILSDEAYDKQMNFDDEKLDFEKIVMANEEKKYPDEIDTPLNMPAKVRFQKYRALESFRTSPWDKKENLPYDYTRIFQFQNFERTKKRVLNDLKSLEGACPGCYISIYITGVEITNWNRYIQTNSHVIIYGLLPHEHQMSVMNAVVTRTSGSEIPIKSKERMIVQCGNRRFVVNPIFSQHTNGDKHKYERYFRAGETVVATFFAPIQFPPAPVLCFIENPNLTLSLVATGRLISCNPDRVILKRVVLSGHPYKIHRKTATIRYMFFNKDDVNYFKPCRLRTKCGRQGHIKESLGTHGHMKCVFDGPLKSFDTVLLHLYKRVFPKWTYNNYVVGLKNENEDVEMS